MISGRAVSCPATESGAGSATTAEAPPTRARVAASTDSLRILGRMKVSSPRVTVRERRLTIRTKDSFQQDPPVGCELMIQKPRQGELAERPDLFDAAGAQEE